MKRGRGNPEPTQDRVWIDIDRDLPAALRATGPGWKGRLDEMLREAPSRGATSIEPPAAA